jgi:tRNA threonylcarbamoyladenosine biosynthesis protein TsaE
VSGKIEVNSVNSLAEMHKLGARIGEQLRAGDLILLSGPLGAGKTALTQGIGHSLGIKSVTSPTFVISRIHPGKVPLVHVDAYRLQGDSAAIFDDLDLESYLPTSVTVVEWGEGLADRLADEYLEIQIQDICNYLKIETKIIKSSDIPNPTKLQSEDRIIQVCKFLGAKNYLNASGGRGLYEPQNFSREGIELNFLPEYMGNKISILEQIALKTI